LPRRDAQQARLGRFRIGQGIEPIVGSRARLAHESPAFDAISGGLETRRRRAPPADRPADFRIDAINVMTVSLRGCYGEFATEEAAMSATVPKRDTLNIRIKPEERDLIDRAAKTRGKNRTDFILDAARQAAEDALLDRAVFTVSPEAYAEFLARLDAPAQSNERLRRIMQAPAPWDHA
jgi:uncharacterized protein (DUF1778 family)